ncbi:MAG: tyrosine-type recombinase/integrase [Candidatus Brocadiia bacterium]
MTTWSKETFGSSLFHPMDLHDLHSRFLEHATYFWGRSKATVSAYKMLIEFFLNITRLSDTGQVTEDRVREFFFVGRTQRGWSARTYRAYWSHLRQFFRWCVKGGHLLADPTQGIEVPKLERKLPAKLSRQDANRILEYVDNYPYPRASHFIRCRNHALMATLLFTGLRKSEALGLRCGDVDLENRSMFVRQGKGAKDRVVPICATLAGSLARYVEARRQRGKTCPEFFTSMCRDCRFTVEGLTQLIKKIRVGTGIKFSAHKLRHTFATLMLEGGCDIYSISKMMGHSDIKTTTIYLAASAEHLRSQIARHPLNSIGCRTYSPSVGEL